MSTFRAILIALVAMSVALLPVAGGLAAANAPAASLMAAPSDCCAHGKPCDQKGPGGCGSVAGCVLNCFGLSAVLTPALVTPTPRALEPSVLVIQTAPSASDNPPLPPPRV